MSAKILIVEDELDLVRLLKYNLSKEGFEVGYATDGRVALTELRRKKPDLVLLDLTLPSLDGLEICRQMRRVPEYSEILVIILTARHGEEDRVVGLEIGANDYVTKPFSIRELVARIRVQLRSQRIPSSQRALQRDELFIDPSTHAVKIGSRNVVLSALEFRLLYHLASYPEMVFSRQQLIDRVWDRDGLVTSRTVDVCVRRIREKIESDDRGPKLLETVHGVGYRFAASDQS